MSGVLGGSSSSAAIGAWMSRAEFKVERRPSRWLDVAVEVRAISPGISVVDELTPGSIFTTTSGWPASPLTPGDPRPPTSPPPLLFLGEECVSRVLVLSLDGGVRWSLGGDIDTSRDPFAEVAEG